MLSGEARIVRDGQGITPGLGFQVAHVEAIRAKRGELEDFVRRLAKARVWESANRETYAATWSKLIGLPKEIPLRWFAGANTRPVPIDAEVVAAEQRTIDLYLRNGLITKPHQGCRCARSVVQQGGSQWRAGGSRALAINRGTQTVRCCRALPLTAHVLSTWLSSCRLPRTTHGQTGQ